MPRLFTGLEIPRRVADDLALLRGGLFGARWIDPEHYHLTLRFIGDIDHATARDVVHELDRIARPAFAVTLRGLAAFGGDRPRALVAAADPDKPLLALQAEHERTLRRIGLTPETRKYTPHVTLARLRGVGPESVADYLTARGRAAPRVFEASRFVVFSARDSVGGGPYVVEATYPLQAAADARGAALRA